MRDLESTGYKRLVLKCDQESANEDVMKNVKSGTTSMEIRLEYSPVRDKQANGEAERAIQSVQGIARTIKKAVEIAIDEEIPVDHPVMA